MKYIKLKTELKAVATRLKNFKLHRKQDNRGDWSLQNLEYEIWRDKREFRCKHIAYCLLRGRDYSEIEHPAEDNRPNWKYIERIQEKHREETNVCSGS